MIDVFAALQLGEAAFELGLQWSDLMWIYGKAQGGKIDFAALAKSEDDVKRVGRIMGVFSRLLNDDKQRPKAMALITQIGSLSK